jgi:putative ABC transport system substrate-binding protein
VKGYSVLAATVKRRAMLAGALAGAAGVRSAYAAERIVGWVSSEAPEAVAPFITALKAGVARNLAPGAAGVTVIERNGASNDDIAARHVDELQKLGARLIVAHGAATPAVIRAKPSVPVVYGYSGDPVAAGFAVSLAQPGGNATGMTFLSIELMPKRIDLLRTALPACRRIALLSNSRHPGEAREITACQVAVQPADIQLSIHALNDASELKPALAAAFSSGAQAVVALPSGLMVRHAPTMAASCIEQRIPLISGWASIARSGALMTYGPSLAKAWGRVGFYALRVLDGAAPATLPIEQPTEFELALNMKTAAAIGITVPPSLLAQADEIIE